MSPLMSARARKSGAALSKTEPAQSGWCRWERAPGGLSPPYLPKLSLDCGDKMRAFILRAIRAVKLLARDGRIPKTLRWLAALGLLPVPGPFDEAVLLIVGALMFVFYREPLREAWAQAGARYFAKAS